MKVFLWWGGGVCANTYKLLLSDLSEIVKNLWDVEDASPGTELACSAIDARTRKLDHSTYKYIKPETRHIVLECYTFTINLIWSNKHRCRVQERFQCHRNVILRKYFVKIIHQIVQSRVSGYGDLFENKISWYRLLNSHMHRRACACSTTDDCWNSNRTPEYRFRMSVLEIILKVTPPRRNKIFDANTFGMTKLGELKWSGSGTAPMVKRQKFAMK